MSTVKNVLAIKTFTNKIALVLRTEALANARGFINSIPAEEGKSFLLKTKNIGFTFYNNSNIGVVTVKSFTKGTDLSSEYCTMRIDNTYGFGLLIIEFKHEQSLYVQDSGYRFDDYEDFVKMLNEIIGIDLNV